MDDLGAAGCHQTLFRGHEFIPDNDAGDWSAACCPGLIRKDCESLNWFRLVQEEDDLMLPAVAMAKPYQNMVSFVQGVGHPKKIQELSH